MYYLKTVLLEFSIFSQTSMRITCYAHAFPWGFTLPCALEFYTSHLAYSESFSQKYNFDRCLQLWDWDHNFFNPQSSGDWCEHCHLPYSPQRGSGYYISTINHVFELWTSQLLLIMLMFFLDCFPINFSTLNFSDKVTQ